MSPSKTRKPVATLRPRSEYIVAIAVSVSIVLGTVLLIWLLRPADPNKPGYGTGGLMTRQPRVSLLVFLTVAAIAISIIYILRGRHRPKRVSPRVSGAIAVTVCILGAVALAILWPGGLIKHWPPQPKAENNNPVTTPTTGASVTTSPATTAPTATTAPATTTPTTAK